MIHSVAKLNPNALKFAFMIGSFLFVMNHGPALIKGEMTAHRWFSAMLGYGVPLVTSIYCPCARRSSPPNVIPEG